MESREEGKILDVIDLRVQVRELDNVARRVRDLSRKQGVRQLPSTIREDLV
jgi:hypothetical protein